MPGRSPEQIESDLVIEPNQNGCCSEQRPNKGIWGRCWCHFYLLWTYSRHNRCISSPNAPWQIVRQPPNAWPIPRADRIRLGDRTKPKWLLLRTAPNKGIWGRCRCHFYLLWTHGCHNRCISSPNAPWQIVRQPPNAWPIPRADRIRLGDRTKPKWLLLRTAP
jgi:hypothetical protein